jgi:hypothetical protein
MPRLTIAFGAFLAILGVVTYLATSASSITALIPTMIGIPMLLAGLVSQNPRWQKPAFIVAVLLTVAMVAGSFRGVSQVIQAATGDGSVSFPAVLQVVLVILSLIYLVFAARSLFTGPRMASNR